jgi:hypothetical protein
MTCRKMLGSAWYLCVGFAVLVYGAQSSAQDVTLTATVGAALSGAYSRSISSVPSQPTATCASFESAQVIPVANFWDHYMVFGALRLPPELPLLKRGEKWVPATYAGQVEGIGGSETFLTYEFSLSLSEDGLLTAVGYGKGIPTPILTSEFREVVWQLDLNTGAFTEISHRVAVTTTGGITPCIRTITTDLSATAIFPIRLSESCALSLSFTNFEVDYRRTPATVQVLDLGPACAWRAVSSDPTWLQVSAASEFGSRPLSFIIQRNSSAGVRRGTVTVNGVQLTVIQHAAIIRMMAATEVVPSMPNALSPLIPVHVIVENETGAPINGFTVAFESELTDAAKAAHAHEVDDGAPGALFRLLSCTTGENEGGDGTCGTEFLAPVVSGIYQLRAVAGDDSAHVRATSLTVRVRDLEELGVSIIYDLVVSDKSKRNHPNSWYGRPAVVRDLRKVAAKYASDTAQRLSFNDLSLVWGGLYDIFVDWKAPHGLHRAGCSVDINRMAASSGQATDDRKLQKIMDAFNFYKVVENKGEIHYQRIDCAR